MKYVKEASLLTLITLYLFVCGSLYLLGFWSTFNIDISDIVDIAQIPKSFIMPFIISNGVFIIFFIMVILSSHSKKDEIIGLAGGVPLFSTKAIIIFDIILNAAIALAFTIVIWTYIGYKLSSTYWTASGSILSLLISIKLCGFSEIKKIFPNSLIRMYVMTTGITCIIMSLCLGKAESVKIYTNKSIKYINATTANIKIEIHPTKDSTRLKLLGFLGNKVIISSLDNKKIYILRQDAVDVLEIEGEEK